MKIKNQRIILIYLLVELLLLNLIIYAIFFTNRLYLDFNESLALVVANLGWILIALLNDHRYYAMHSPMLKFKEIFRAFAQFLGFLLVGSVVFNLKGNFADVILQAFFVFLFLDLVFLEFLRPFFCKYILPKAFSSNILILGTQLQSSRLLEFTSRNSHLGFKVLGLLDDQPQSVPHETMEVLGGVDDLAEVLEQTRVDEIIVTWPLSRMHEIDYVIDTADQRGVRVSLMPSLSGDVDFSIGARNMDSLPILNVRDIPLDHFTNALIKRIFDVVFAGLVLIVLSPVFLLIAMLVKLSSRGPILYKPYRNGQAGGQFICYKFRTMKECDSEKNGQRSTIKNDPRLTRIGKFLRKYDLDELPQFYNVLIGDMSVVGPRPHRVFLNDTLKNVVERSMIRHYVKPGVTGWAQVNGWRGPTDTNEQRIERINHDLWYIRHWSLWLDIKVIFLTVFGKKVRTNAF